MVLSLLLAFLLVGCVLAQGSISFEQVCLESGSTQVLVSNKRECPCFIETILGTDVLVEDVNAVVYAVPLEGFEEWVENAKIERQSGSALLPDVPGKNLGTASFNKFDSKERKYLWRSGFTTFEDQGTHVLLVKLEAGPTERCIYISVRLRLKPDTCPLRLAPRPNAVQAVSRQTAVRQEVLTNYENYKPSDSGGAMYVVGGTEVDNEFLRYNALVRTRRGRCSASVISPDWVLTAAHCNVKVGEKVYVAGRGLSNGKLYRIDQVMPHPRFTHENDPMKSVVRIYNDIVLLRVNKRMKGRFVALNSNSNGPPAGTLVRATGYGQVTTGVSGDNLRMVDITVLTSNECKRRFIRSGSQAIANGLNSNLTMCIGGDEMCDRGGVCFGDSGGPVVARNVDGSLLQIGIVSYGDTVCASSNSADVYVRVSEYIDWIQDVTGGAARTLKWGEHGDGGGGIWGRSGVGKLPVWALVVIAISAFAIVACIVIFAWLQTRSQTRNSDVEHLSSRASERHSACNDSTESAADPEESFASV